MFAQFGVETEANSQKGRTLPVYWHVYRVDYFKSVLYK